MISVTKARLRSVVVTAGVLALAATAAPAQAEGSFSSYIDNWLAGSNESRRWADKNTDATSTSVAFSGCSTDPGSFYSVSPAVYKDVFGPDENKGTKTNYCGTSTWGDLAAGDYYFRLELINGGATGYRFDSASVAVRY
ncbi:hypothetical protein ACFZCG_39260 [Streptomyces tanashiensis]|uniref:hypothetical protein n=1 Tax=Streptomyces tanashiensis TaxID=67367 RepID=UPI0036E37447